MTYGSCGVDDYRRWISAHDTVSDDDRLLIGAHVKLLPRHPIVTIALPAYETPEAFLRQAIASVRAQLYPFWELCVADDASPSTTVARVLREVAGIDPRVRWTNRSINGGFAAATNTAIALATGEFVALMNHDDLLAETALYEVAVEIVGNPDADIVYSDEDCVDDGGTRFDPHFKPMWSPERLAGHDMIGRLSVYRRSLLEQLGGLRAEYEGNERWDLALRATSATTPDRIRHIPRVLYHKRRSAKAPSRAHSVVEKRRDAGRRAVSDWLVAEGVCGARVEPSRINPDWTRVVFPLPAATPLISVIVPTRDRAALLRRVCSGILRETEWPSDRLELLIVDNDSAEPDALDLIAALKQDTRVRVFRCPGPFNYSRLNNMAAREARGDVLLLLNNDIEVLDAGWLKELVRHAMRREVGAVGAKLLYPDGTVQHGGVVMGPDGNVGHVLRFARGDDPGYFGQLALAQALCVVTGACIATRRDVFEEVGGLEETLAITFNDSDLCLRIRDRGYRVVWTPDAVLMHWESATRGQDSDAVEQVRTLSERTFMRRRWGRVLDEDPYHNSNVLLHEGGGPLIPAPPRRVKPWRAATIARPRPIGL